MAASVVFVVERAQFLVELGDGGLWPEGKPLQQRAQLKFVEHPPPVESPEMEESVRILITARDELQHAHFGCAKTRCR